MTTNITLTTNERNVLNAIAHHEYAPSNGSRPEDIEDTGTFCFIEDFARTAYLTVNQTKGVLGSLVSKGAIVIREFDREDNTVDFTREGFEAWEYYC